MTRALKLEKRMMKRIMTRKARMTRMRTKRMRMMMTMMLEVVCLCQAQIPGSTTSTPGPC